MKKTLSISYDKNHSFKAIKDLVLAYHHNTTDDEKDFITYRFFR
ncbi:hypothetical protein [uncultured Aquimarina sp.]|nr:hypothetical protein [uncultured Aquimarina sp.]